MLSFSFVVTNTNDFGPGSLRQAMAAADLAPGPSEITFNLPLNQASNGVFAIQPESPLPTLNDVYGGIKIDGSTQTDFTGDSNPSGPEIVLDGAAAGTTANGLVLTSNDNLISGLDIRNFAGSAVVISGSGAYDNVVAGNYLGTDATGLNAMANGWYGVDLADGAHDNLVGGSLAAARNVISGNGVFGILLSGAGVSANRVQGNYIGVDSTGAAGLGNGWDGVSISYQAAGNWIGTDGDGTADDREGNVISANHNQNISLYTASDNVIAGNFIGTDATGNKALGVRFNGIWIGGGSRSNIIGTNSDGVSDAAERNVISGNSIYGIAMYDANTDHNIVAGNYIGTDVTGNFAIANGNDGIYCSASGNTFGGSSLAARNIISGNAGDGIRLDGASSNVVAGNYIGVDHTGASALPNGNSGIWLTGAASGNLIGTNGDGVADAAERNVISGNLHDGVTIAGGGDNGNAVAGNYIGTDATGTLAIGNAASGVAMFFGPQLNRIGTDGSNDAFNADEGNVISGGVYGIYVYGVGTSANVIAGNHIGTNAAGTAAIPNRAAGVIIFGGAADNRIGTNGDGIADAAERNVISGNGGNGVLISDSGTSGNVIAGNYIGVNATASKPLANGVSGVFIYAAAGNRVGTDGNGIADAAERDIISGNLRDGITITNSGANGNAVAGNYIGTDVTGTLAIGNAASGVAINFGAQSNCIGSDGSNDAFNADEANLISGNHYGIQIYGVGSSNNVVAGNRVGTDAAGTAAIPNRAAGVIIFGAAANNRIGTNGDGVADATERNVISGNGGNGVLISDNGTSSNVIAGNYLGVDVTASKPLANGVSGVFIYAAAGNRIGTDGNGVADTAERNIISGNLSDGVTITNSSANGNSVAGNYIGSDATGTAALPNGANGISIDGSSDNTIGGATAGAENVISGNAADGIWVDSASSENMILGNVIGVAAPGAAAPPSALANGANGVEVAGFNNTIGGNSPGASNVISGNDANGVLLNGVNQSRALQLNSAANQFVASPVNISPSAMPEMTMGGWFYASSIVTSTNSIRGLISADDGGFDRTLDVDTRGGAGLRWSAFTGSGVLGGPLVQANTWTFVAVRYDQSSGQVVLDVDGQQFTASGVVDSTSTSTTTIGRNPNFDFAFDGLVSDVFIYGSLLSDAQLADIEANGAPVITGASPGSLAAFYPFGGAYNDASGNGNNASPSPSAPGFAFIDPSAPGFPKGTPPPAAYGNVVEGNDIGTDASGTLAIGNRHDGVAIESGAYNNTIGGATAGAGNVIASNLWDGVLVDATSNHNTIFGNNIGVSAIGQAALGNLQNGVSINGHNNSVGGTAAGEGNTIAFNGEAGVLVAGAAGGNALRGNSIDANGGLGINLAGGAEDASGVTADDLLDSDSGPNNLQNYPVLNFARSGAKTLVSGAFNSAPNATFVLDFYAGNAVDPSGFGEAQRWLGATTVTTDDNGNAAFSSLLDGSTGPSDYVSATATDAAGNTSEFSLTLTLDRTAPTSTINPLPVRATSLSFPVSVTGSDPDAAGQVTSGVAAYDLYASADGGSFAYWTTVPAGSPSPVFTAQSSHLYSFRSVAIDNAGNLETKPVAVEASIYVPDLDPPVSHVDNVDSSSPRFKVSFSATDTGGSGLGMIGVFVEIDGAEPQQIATANAAGSSSYSGSVQYQALEDGAAHNYRFYTVAADRNNNVEAAPAAPNDVELDNVLYSVPATLQVTGFLVEQGAVERSFIRYLEIDFNRNVAGELQAIVATLSDGIPADEHMSLTRYDLSGKNPVDATSVLAGANIEVVGQAILIDFGPNGIGGNRNSNAGDGYYTLAFDLDNSLTNGPEATDSFYRLFGDTNGDRTVNLTDLANIAAAFGQTGIDLNADINGDGVVNILDRLYASHELGRTLDGNLPLDD